MAVLGFLAAMVMPFIGHLDNKQRIKATRERLEAVRTALVGPQNTYDERGLRVVRGYAGDMDALPKLYRFNWDDVNNRWNAVAEEVYHGGDPEAAPPYIGQPCGLWEKQPAAGEDLGANWKGPYLNYPEAVFANQDKKDVVPLRRTEGILADAWGRALFFIKEQGDPGDPNSIYLLVVSAGPDGRVELPSENDTWPGVSPPAPLMRNSYQNAADPDNKNNDNIVLEITPEEWFKPNESVQRKQTVRILEEIRAALLGPADAFDPSGRCIVGGYIGDMGQWPTLWQWDADHWDPGWYEGQPRGLWTWDTAEGYSDHDQGGASDPTGFCWRGPYLQKPWGVGEDEVLRDTWGTPLRFRLSEDETTLRITSAGGDKNFDTADDIWEGNEDKIKDDLQVVIRDTEWKAVGMTVEGKIVNNTQKKYVRVYEYDEQGNIIGYHDEEAPPAQQPDPAEVEITFHHQPEKSLTETFTVDPGQTILFQLCGGDVFGGVRRLDIAAGPGQLKSPENVKVFVGAGGTQSPVVEKLVIIVESPSGP